jgi:hypothetical protein
VDCIQLRIVYALHTLQDTDPDVTAATFSIRASFNIGDIGWFYMFFLLIVSLYIHTYIILNVFKAVLKLWICDIKLRSYNWRLISAYTHPPLIMKCWEGNYVRLNSLKMTSIEVETPSRIGVWLIIHDCNARLMFQWHINIRIWYQ